MQTTCRYEQEAILACNGRVAALAGCTGEDGDDGDPDDGSGGDEADGPDPEVAAEHIEAAVESLEENGDRIDEFADEEGTPDRWNADEIERRVDDAESELDEAEAHATADQRALIDTLRDVGTFQRSVAAYNDLAVDVDNCWERTDAYVDTGQWNEAADHFESCQETLEELQDAHDEARRDFDAIDESELEDAELEFEDLSDELTMDADDLDVLVEVMDGFGQFLDGVALVIEGLDAFDDERFDDAESLFDDARGPLHASAETFSDLEDDPDLPGHYGADVVGLACETDAFATANDHFASAATAADEEDWETAEEEMEAGNEALDAC